MTRHVQPYPWDQLPRLTGAQAQLLNALTRTLAHADTQAAALITSKLLGCSISLRRFEIVNRRQPNPHAPTLELRGDASVICELPGSFAAWIVERALGGDAELVTMDAGLSLRDETSLGVLAYVAARMLPTLPATFSLEAVEGTARSAGTVLTRAPATCIALHLGVASAEVTLHLWVIGPWTPPTIAPRQRNVELTRWLLDERVPLSAQLMHRCQLGSAALASLRIDDVVLVRHASVTGGAHFFEGTVQVIVVGAHRLRWIAHAQGNRIELGQRQTTEEQAMTTGKVEPQDASIERTFATVSDAPLELSVELARVTLPLGEIAALMQGDVLMSGRPIGEHVTLRAGSRAIATGELVNVDGTIGVRIVSLAGSSIARDVHRS